MTTIDDDIGSTEYWRDIKQAKQEKRADNRENSARCLRENGIAFEEKNMGAHLIVTGNGHTFDFWPGTGLWQMRGSTKRHRGVRSLVKLLAPANV